MKRNEIKIKGIPTGWKRFTECIPTSEGDYLVLLPTIDSLTDDESDVLILLYKIATINFYKDEEDETDNIVIYEQDEANGSSLYYYNNIKYLYNGPINEIGNFIGSPLYWMDLPALPNN